MDEDCACSACFPRLCDDVGYAAIDRNAVVGNRQREHREAFRAIERRQIPSPLSPAFIKLGQQDHAVDGGGSPPAAMCLQGSEAERHRAAVDPAGKIERYAVGRRPVLLRACVLSGMVLRPVVPTARLAFVIAFAAFRSHVDFRAARSRCTARMVGALARCTFAVSAHGIQQLALVSFPRQRRQFNAGAMGRQPPSNQ